MMEPQSAHFTKPDSRWALLEPCPGTQPQALLDRVEPDHKDLFELPAPSRRRHLHISSTFKLAKRDSHINFYAKRRSFSPLFMNYAQ